MDMVLDITAGTAQNGLPPALMQIKYIDGTAFGGATTPVGNLPATQDMTAVPAALNSSASSVSLPGPYTTLTLPVQFTTTGGSGRNETFTGTIVANLVVPEPATGLLIALGSSLLLLSRRFRLH
jgi:hypothetical protein